MYEVFAVRAVVTGVLATFALAFASAAPQIRGLLGTKGVLPARAMLVEGKSKYRSWSRRLWVYPTVFWIDLGGDAVLLGTVLVGFVCAVAGSVAIIPASTALAVCTLAYLSLVTVGGDFFAFQWDCLLVEAGYLCWMSAMCLGSDTGPRAVFFPSLGIRWLLFRTRHNVSFACRLMAGSGIVKLTSGCPRWKDLTAMSYHYTTQPLPHAGAWLANKLPLAAHKTATVMTFVAELILPLLLLIPWSRTAAMLVFFGFQGLMGSIMATGNFGFFNVLTMSLTLVLLSDVFPPVPHEESDSDDDGLVASGAGSKMVWALASAGIVFQATLGLGAFVRSFRVTSLNELANKLQAYASGQSDEKKEEEPLDEDAAKKEKGSRSGLQLLAAQVAAMLRSLHQSRTRRKYWWRLHSCYVLTTPFRIACPYGLFASMTTHRREIIIQYKTPSMPHWETVPFAWKPSNPGSTEPRHGLSFAWLHMPRLDWRLWFLPLHPFVSMFAAIRRHFKSSAPDWYKVLLLTILEGNQSSHTQGWGMGGSNVRLLLYTPSLWWWFLCKFFLFAVEWSLAGLTLDLIPL
eukprot:m.256895 g.256895  ORF g.256895 m.256895 type:complete len:572 (-) comp19176_c0_seq10:461-2176(-)